MYEVGEVVKVADIGRRYSTYYNWFDLHARDVRPSVVALYASDFCKELYTKVDYKIIAKVNTKTMIQCCIYCGMMATNTMHHMILIYY